MTLQEAVSLGFGAYQTLRRYIANGNLPAVKIGSRVKVLRSDLEALAIPKPVAACETVEAAIERIVAAAHPLTDAQIRRLASLLGGAA